ncbi:MAG: hypothetical protein AB8B68_03875 [Rickettsiaceae bacterium]
MDPLAISSVAVTSFSIILSIGSAIYKSIKKQKEEKKKDEHKDHHFCEAELLYLEEHKEHTQKHKHPTKEINREGSELPYVIEHHYSDSHAKVDLSGEYEFSLGS